MNIIITENARQYLRERNKENIVISIAKQMCWGGRSTKFVVVSTKEKINKEKFDKYASGEFTIYIEKDIVVKKDEVVIDLERFFFSKILSQKGLTI